MFKTHREAAGLSQLSVYHTTGIPVQTIIDYEKLREYPKPGEVKTLDKLYGANGALTLKYCARRCLEGLYVGHEYPDSEPVIAMVQLINFLGENERQPIWPEIAGIAAQILKGQVDHGNRKEMHSKIRRLRQCLQAAEVVLAKEDAAYPPKIAGRILAMLGTKEKAACTVGAAHAVTL